MKQPTTSSRRNVTHLGFVICLLPVTVLAEGHSMVGPASSEAFAFARYLTSAGEGGVFPEKAPMVIEIEASLPGLHKETRLLAIRRTVESERSEFLVVKVEGDVIVAQEVVGRYLLLQQQLDSLPVSSVAITPANYKFHYKGEVGAGRSLAYVYQITPKTKRDGLIEGQVWIDSESGAAVLEAGRYVKMSYSFARGVEIVRDTRLIEGQACMRTTHVTIDTMNAGRGELTITERPVTLADESTASHPQQQ